MINALWFSSNNNNARINTLLEIPPKPALKRSTKWPYLRRKWLKLHPLCAFCSSKVSIQVHHIIPVHVSPELELNENNLMSLCESSKRQCHFIFGHLYDWLNYNKDIKLDVVVWSAKEWTH